MWGDPRAYEMGTYWEENRDSGTANLELHSVEGVLDGEAEGVEVLGEELVQVDEGPLVEDPSGNVGVLAEKVVPLASAQLR